MSKRFQFDLDQRVVIKSSGETGVVASRAEYNRNRENQYHLEYVNAVGCAVDQWFDESKLRAVTGAD